LGNDWRGQIGEIRRAYFEQHRSIKEIVRTLSVSRATVRKVVRVIFPRKNGQG
jgi:DNA-binding transcriptional regulator LsrR (DeoR family)